jgi:outer membrane cobalamin receptor
VRLNADLQWVDSRYVLNPRFAPGQAEVDGYLLGNAKIDVPWRAFGFDLDGAVFVSGENLFDEDYEHRLGYPMPGRSVQVGVDVGF